uniref:Lipase domain-containing protein n=1 Tax=Heliothis virescens TaxID=7102 RepID=A0A2A4JPF3_HELVI
MYQNILKTAVTVLCLLELTQAASLRCFNGSLDNYIEAPLDDPTPVTALLTKNFTMIFSGGYQSVPTGPANTAMMQACLTKNDTACCILNWSAESSCVFGYLCVVERVETVGNQLGEALVILFKTGKLLLESLILIGHSLACHVLGYAGRKADSLGYKLLRITGLDPAGPLYNPPSKYIAFSYTDAVYTEAMHTDPGGYGIINSTVTVQYWPNTVTSGSQNGCFLSLDSMCSHNRAYQYAAEKITTPGSLLGIFASSYTSWINGEGDRNRIIEMPAFFDPGAKTLLYLTPVLLIGLLELTQAASIICYNGSLSNYKETPLEEPLAILPGLVKDLKTVFYTFGYRGKVKGPATTAMIEAYVAKNKSNICLLNWENEAESTLLGTRIGYLYAVNNVVKIGNQLGDALVTLIKAGLNVVDLQLIAHSLGAHLMGYAGRRVRKLGYVIPRVTGLDPAGVFFEGFTIYQALDRKSGLFVDVIHTDAGGYGMRKSDVTVEFWPNTEEKESQPGCPVGDFELFTKEYPKAAIT